MDKSDEMDKIKRRKVNTKQKKGVENSLEKS
jgi:hypothetical protein